MFIIEPGGSSGDWKTSEGIASGRRPEREAAGRERRSPAGGYARRGGTISTASTGWFSKTTFLPKKVALDHPIRILVPILRSER